MTWGTWTGPFTVSVCSMLVKERGKKIRARERGRERGRERETERGGEKKRAHKTK